MTQTRPRADRRSVWKGEIDYDLPRELIAQHPVAVRDQSRLMVIDRKTARIEHRRFKDIVSLIEPNDVLVANDSRVLPARLYANKSTGGRVEFLILDAMTPGPVTAMVRTSKRLVVDQQLELPGNGAVRVAELLTGGRVKLDFGRKSALDVLTAQGEIPLPPYIERPDGPTPDDPARYQTVYCRSLGSVAAPTAGLHFTPGLLSDLTGAGVGFERVTLHVGPGTFSPIRGALDEHRMDREHCVVDEETVARIERRRAKGGRLVAVGTTSVRTLESAAAGGRLAAYANATDLFIRPGHLFKTVDVLITNFHLPGSTLLCLVMAFAGTDLIRQAYDLAIAEKYRFYSYGDAMLIV